MTFDEILEAASEMLRRRKKVSVRAFRRQYNLSKEALEDLIYELVEVQKIADRTDEVLIWNAVEESYFHPAGKAFKPQQAERRQLTVMFIDLVGSTALSRKLDPEDLRDVLFKYQELFGKVSTRNQGVVVQYLGDGVLSYFGYPTAHENDPQNAIRCGLEMLEAVEDLNAILNREKKINVQVRIGIHTGVVVVGSTGSGQYADMLALGEAPNLAAHIQNKAHPNTVLISAVTNKLVQGHFHTELIGGHVLKGSSEPVDLYRVLAKKTPGYLAVSTEKSLTSLIGRVWEKSQISDGWNSLDRESGKLITISGEAGIGKSRFVRSVIGDMLQQERPALVFRSSPYHRNTTFQPIIDRLVAEIGLQHEDSDDENFQRLQKYAPKVGATEQLDIAILERLLGYSSFLFESLPVASERRKVLTFRFLRNWLLGETKKGLVLFEDLHWADPSSLELLQNVFSRIHHHRILLLVTFRSEFQLDWETGKNTLHIALHRLNRKQSADMIRQIAGELPEEVLEMLLNKTDGNTLFIEEMTKLLLESNVLEQKFGGYKLVGSLKSLSIPNTLQDSLMARLDRLGATKEVAQIGATIGREFSYVIVKAISQLHEEELITHLTKLIDSEMILAHGDAPDLIYTFRHALLQEAAYSSLLKKRRQVYHKRIVDTLENLLPDVIHANPELLAQHCTEGGLFERAIPYWHAAGDLAINRSAHREAIHHIGEGLKVLKELDSEKHRIDEIRFHIALGVPLTALRGYSSKEVEANYLRAQELCEYGGDPEYLVPALYGLWRYYMLKADYLHALAIGDQIVDLSKISEDLIHRVIGHRTKGSIRFYLGQLAKARDHFDLIFNSEITPTSRENTLLYDVVDAWVTAKSYSSWTFWLTGYPDQALRDSQEAIEMAHRLSHPFSIALANSFAAWLHQWRGEKADTERCARDGLKMAEVNGFKFWIGWCEILLAWSTADNSKPAKTISKMHTGLGHWRSTGSLLGDSYFLLLLVDQYLIKGSFREAQNLIDSIKIFIARTSEGWWEPEVLRYQGLLHEKSSNPDLVKALDCYEQAVVCAQERGMKSLELRATTNLSRLLHAQGKSDQASKVLTPMIEWFSEGRELSDWKTAKQLLDQIDQQQNYRSKKETGGKD